MRVRNRITCVTVKSFVQPFLNFNLLEPLLFFEIFILPGVLSKLPSPGIAVEVAECEKRSLEGEAGEMASQQGIVEAAEMVEWFVAGEPGGLLG